MTLSGGHYGTPWTQTFQYDGFGNLTAKVLNGTSTSIPVNAATNRLTNAYYDANGNMTSGAGATLTYDEANPVSTVMEASGGQEAFAYDASNKRIYMMDQNSQEWFTLFSARGEKLGKYRMTMAAINGPDSCGYQNYNLVCPMRFSPYETGVWFAGRLVANPNNNPSGGQVTAFLDRMGSNRARGTFYPYGENQAGADDLQFATYTRDSYSGLDYADQRFYASTYGRFLTADPASRSIRPGIPQSWNRYSYTIGDPVNRNDPGGTTDWGLVTKGGLVTGGSVIIGVTTGGAGTLAEILALVGSAGGFVVGSTTIVAGITTPGSTALPSVYRGLNQANMPMTPGGLVCGALSGGNPTAIRVCAGASSVLSTTLSIQDIGNAGNLLNLTAGFYGVYSGLDDLNSVISDSPAPVLVSPTPVEININGQANTVEPIVIPTDTNLNLTTPGDSSPPSVGDVGTVGASAPGPYMGVTPWACQYYDIGNWCLAQLGQWPSRGDMKKRNGIFGNGLKRAR